MARDPLSDLRKAYAEATGVSLRTAQRHADPDNPHPDWLRFTQTTAATGAARKVKEGGALAPVEATALGMISPYRPETQLPAFYDVPDEDLHPVERMEKDAWQLHEKTFRLWEELVGDPLSTAIAIVYARELPKLRENHEKARREREAWELTQRIIVTLPEFQAFQHEFLTPLAELLRGIPVELPSVVNPENVAFARQQLRDWLVEKVNPRIEEMMRAANELRPAA